MFLFFFFFLFSLEWHLDDHSTPSLMEHTLDEDTSGNGNGPDSHGGNSWTGDAKCNSSAHTSSGNNSGSNCISAPSHPSSSSNKAHSCCTLGDKGLSGNQHLQGCGANLDITHLEDALNSPPEAVFFTAAFASDHASYRGTLSPSIIFQFWLRTVCCCLLGCCGLVNFVMHVFWTIVTLL